VLVVENDTDTRQMYVESFEFSGVRAVASTTGQDALEKARDLRPDVITTDLGLSGGMDGCQLTEALKQDARTKRIPVVAVTAWAIGGYVERARLAGCDSVIVKPVTPADLLVEIHRLLKSTPSRTRG
jgi:CheY-like chemotaxis protein